MKNNSSVAENTLKVLLLFSDYKELSAKQISSNTGINITSVYRILNTLEDTGFIEKTEKIYRLCIPHIYRLYNSLELSFNSAAKQVIKGLVDKYGESVYLSELIGRREFAFIEREDSPSPLRWSANTKDVFSLPTGTAGKTHTAYLLKDLTDDEKRQFIKELPIEKYTDHTIVDSEELIDSLNKIVSIGHTVTFGEHLKGVIGIAVPVSRKDSSKVKHVLSMFMPDSRYNENMLPEWISALKTAAKDLNDY